MKKIILFCIVLVCANHVTLFAQFNKLPSVSVLTLDGNKVDISKLSENGEIVILDFWATWCVPCKRELNNIVDLYPDWQKDYNAVIYAVSIDDSRNTTIVKPTVEGSKWPYKILLDPNQDLKRVLGFQNVPYVMVADKNGNIVYQHTGYVEGDEFELEDQLKKMASGE